MQTTQRTLLLGIVLLLGLAGCGDDDATPTDAGSADAGTDAGSPDAGSDAGADDPAYMVVQRVRTPDSRTVLLTLLSDLGARTLDGSGALEVAGLSRATAFDGKVFVFDGETGRVTRYGVTDELGFVEEDTVSFEALGIVRFRTAFHFESPERAFYLDLPSLQMVVWNPTEMSIVDTFDVPEADRDGLNRVGGELLAQGGELISPISWDDLTRREFVPSVAALVFSLDTGAFLRVIEDPRCVVTGGAFVDGERVYLLGDSSAGTIDIFGEDFGLTEPVPPPCVVRTDASGAIDPDFAVDLRALTGAAHVTDAVGLGGRRFLTRVFDESIDPETLTDPFLYFTLELWRFAVVDLDADTAEIVDELPISGISFDPSVVDGEALLPVVDEGAGTTTLFRLTGDGPVESVTAAGDIQRVVRVR